MSYRIALILMFVSLALVLIGCPGDPPPPQNVTITLGEIISEPKQVELERYTQNNCGGSSETDYGVGRSRVIVREIEVGAGFEANAKGEVSVLGTGVALGAAVSGQVGSTYGTQDSLARVVTVRAAPGTKMEHEISHQEIWKVGTATVVVNGQRIEVPFRYRHEFTLVLLDSRQLSCDHTPTPAVTYTPSGDNSVASPTADTPISTNTKVPPPPTETHTPVPSPTNSSTPLPPIPTSTQSVSASCTHMVIGASETVIPSDMWVATRICSPARSACFYTVERSTGGTYSTNEHQGSSDRRWVNAYCTEVEAQCFANEDAEAMLTWWPQTPQNTYPCQGTEANGEQKATNTPLTPTRATTTCSAFTLGAEPTSVANGMWVLTRTCSPARSACFYEIEVSAGQQFSSDEHNETRDRRWVNALCSEAEAKTFGNKDATEMLQWWPNTLHPPFPD